MNTALAKPRFKFELRDVDNAILHTLGDAVPFIRITNQGIIDRLSDYTITDINSKDQSWCFHALPQGVVVKRGAQFYYCSKSICPTFH